MDYLIKKEDSSIVQKWSNTVGKVKLPGMTGGDVIFVGDKRPLDLGDYYLVKATEIDEPLDATKKRGDTTVVVSGETVTVTRTATLKTDADLDAEVDAARREAYGSIDEQLDMMYWDMIRGTSNWKEHITDGKANNPK